MWGVEWRVREGAECRDVMGRSVWELLDEATGDGGGVGLP